MIASFLQSGASDKDADGFVRTGIIITEMQGWGFLPSQTIGKLRQLTNKRLIETTERITFEEDLVGLIGDMPEGFRVTPIGVYHLQRWAADFAYLDGMVFDTPIFDKTVVDQMRENMESFDIADRYARSMIFRNYLSAVWEASSLRPDYYDWKESVQYGEKNFENVRKAIERNANETHTSLGMRLGSGPYSTGKS